MSKIKLINLWKFTLLKYPEQAKQGYTFITNISSNADEDEKWLVVKNCEGKRQIRGKEFVITGGVIKEELPAYNPELEVVEGLYPVFGRLLTNDSKAPYWGFYPNVNDENIKELLKYSSKTKNKFD